MRLTVASMVLGVLMGAMGVCASLPAAAAEGRPLKDDQCIAQCDDKADKCQMSAGKDKLKRSACDEEYDACLTKCS